MQYDFIVIDSYNLAYRQWWHVRDLSYNGIPTGLEYGFIKKVLGYIKNNPNKIYLAWDGKPVRCNSITEGYKSGRIKVNNGEPDWSIRLNRLREIFSNICYTIYHPEEEADEQIAKFVINNKNKNILIVSNDKDLQQLINSNIDVEAGSVRLDEEACNKEWGIPPYKIALYKALDGDKSDNILGVPRLLTKTKIKLVNMSENIEDLVDHFNDSFLTAKERDKLAQYKDQVILNYRLVNLLNLSDGPIVTNPTGDKTLLKQIVEEMNFSSIDL